MSGFAVDSSAQMRITEFAYNGEEFVEFTNVGGSAIDLAGWSFDDNTRLAGSFDLSPFGTVAAGESVIVAERTDDAFRTAFALCAGAKVIGGSTQGLGRSDEINLFDAGGALIDRLTYNDQTAGGGPRTDVASAWVSAAGLGVNAANLWTLSTVGDAEGSVASTGGFPASPGRSARATVVFDPCAVFVRPDVRITEFAYSGEEFVEIANTGTTAVDLSGWSFDDSSRLPGSLDLSAVGTLAPGEMAYISERSAEDFRAAFGLCPALKVIGNNIENLGRSDEINLFDGGGNLVDRLTYNDEAVGGGPRTNAASATVSAAGLGENVAAEWTLSVPGDAEGSVASNTGFVASPDRTRRSRVVFAACPNPDAGQMRLTEYMYSGGGGEFMEFTNVGGASVDMSGWSFSDSARVAGEVDLSSFGVVAAGESVILTESAAIDFRQDWSLCASQRIQGDSAVGIGRADEINLYDADGRQIDRLSYDDQTLGGPRTQNASAWVSASGLGENDHAQWTLSSVADAESSVAAGSGDIGSPGQSSLASIAFDPCVAPIGAPQIRVDPMASSPYLLLNETAGSTISAVIGDPTDPASTEGIAFVLSDKDSAAADLTVSVSSSNPAVVDTAGLMLMGSGLTRQLQIVASGVGYSTISVRVTDETLASAQYVILYAASAASARPDITRFHTGASDASTVQPVDEDRMLVADDENQALRLYARDFSGAAISSFDFTMELGLEGGANPPEVDIESSARIGDRLYWAGSHGNSTSGALRPNRSRLFASDLTVDAGSVSLTYVDRYDHLRADLIAWDQNNGHGLGANALGFFDSTQVGVEADSINGFNIEAMNIAADGSSALLGFRAPMLPVAARTQGLIVRLLAIDTLVDDGMPGSRAAGSASFDTPILLDLGGRALRSMQRMTSGDYLLIAGPPAEATDAAPADFRLFLWDGDAASAPRLLPAELSSVSSGGSFESLLGASPTLGNEGGEVEVLVDNGDFVYYADGTIAKDLANKALAKFRSEVIEVRAANVFSSGFEGASGERSAR